VIVLSNGYGSLEANANKYTFVWKKIVLKNEDKMMEKEFKK
jgi:hypothetical protein